MRKSHPRTEDPIPLRPVGVALAAVVASLGVGKSAPAEARAASPPLEPTTQEKTYHVDPTNHPAFEEDASMVVGRSAPVEPLRNARQKDLFDR
jgi:hypothetical protein